MFSNIVQNVIGYLTGGSTINETTEKEITEINEILNSDKDIEENIQKESKEDSDGDLLEKTIHGTVTSFFNNKGLIDDSIYFTQEMILGNDQPRMGDEVLVKATRSHSFGGWVASSVQITALWNMEEEDDSTPKPYKDTVIGVVVRLFGNVVQVKTSIDFNVPMSKFKAGFYPFNGDWVSIQVWNKGTESAYFCDSSFVNDIISISPLREKKVFGTVTNIQSHNGFINEEVYFSFSICKKGTFFKKGDKVVALAIESKQTKGNWRAVYIEHNKKDKKTDSKSVTSAIDKSCCDDLSVTKEVFFGNLIQNTKHKKEVFVR